MNRELPFYDLEYAHDMALISDSMGMGLTISSKKTKILAVHTAGRPSQSPRDILLRPSDEPISVVESFEYLGSTISAVYSLDREVRLAHTSVRHRVASTAGAEY